MAEARRPDHLERFTHGFARWAGSGQGFVTAVLSFVPWMLAGHYFHYGVVWENALSVYIGTITFLMVFLMQRSQKKDLLALHVKLDELVASSSQADNRVINIEEQSEKDIVEAQEDRKNRRADDS